MRWSTYPGFAYGEASNVGTGKRRDEQFATICKVAVDNDRPVRIGVNGGSLNQELVMARMQELPTVLAPIIRIRKEELS